MTGAKLDAQIRKLERSAAEVLKMKKESRPKRPIVIEFSGSPKSGKSQAVTSLTIFLKRNGFNVKVLSERASVSPVSDKRSPFFNAWTGCSILTGLIPYLSESVSDVDVVITDRGIFDTLCWFTWLQDEEAMSVEEGEDMVKFFLTKRFRQATDLVLAFTASSEASMEREYANLLTRKLGSIMAPNVLDSYVRSINKTIATHGPDFKNVRAIDTSHTTQNQVAVEVTTVVLSAMRDELVEKVGVFERSSLDIAVSSDSVFSIEKLIDAGLAMKFVPRSEAEKDMGLVQLVPVVVVTDSNLKRVMVFRKRKEALGHAGSPERDKNLLYVGGHLRSEDSFGLERDDLLAVSRVAIQREMNEELGTTLRLDGEPPFGIWDLDGKEPSQKHLAIVHLAKVSFDELKLRLDGYELVQPHNSEVSGQVFDAIDPQLRQSKSLESWSRVILDRVFGVDVAAEVMDFDSLIEENDRTSS